MHFDESPLLVEIARLLDAAGDSIFDACCLLIITRKLKCFSDDGDELCLPFGEGVRKLEEREAAQDVILEELHDGVRA